MVNNTEETTFDTKHVTLFSLFSSETKTIASYVYEDNTPQNPTTTALSNAAYNMPPNSSTESSP